MDQYRFYLRGELGKLGNRGDAKWFLESVPQQSLTQYGIPGVVEQLVARFSTQENVDSFVDALADADLESLTKICSQWRNNSVFDKLQSHSDWHLDTVPLNLIDVPQADGKETSVFIVNIDSGWDEQYAPGKWRERKAEKNLNLPAA